MSNDVFFTNILILFLRQQQIGVDNGDNVITITMVTVIISIF